MPTVNSGLLNILHFVNISLTDYYSLLEKITEIFLKLFNIFFNFSKQPINLTS